MVGISANSVEAAPKNRRAMSTSDSSKSFVTSSTKTSVNDNYTITNKELENLRQNILNKKAILYKGIDNDYINLFDEETKTYFFVNQKKFLTCFVKDNSLDFKVDGNYILKHSNDKYSCYDNIKTIYISENNTESPLQMYIYKLEDDIMTDEMDFASFKINDISSLISSDTLAKVKDTCDFKSYYSDIKNLLIASVTTSGVATAAGATGTVLNVVETVKEKKENEDKMDDKKLSGMNIAEVALSGTSAATNMASAIMNFVSVEKINKLSSQINKCVDASNKLRNEFNNIYEEVGSVEVLDTYGNVVQKCSSLSNQDDTIKTIKSVATASGVTSMVGAAASGASIATNIIGNTSDKVDNNKMNLATSITSGIGTATGLVGTGLNAKNLSQIQDLIGHLEECSDAVDEL